MSNKEKANKLFDDIVDMCSYDQLCKVVADIHDVIELASKPDWFYPSKGEVCNIIGERLLVVHEENYCETSNWVEEVEVQSFEVSKKDSTILYSKEHDEYYSWGCIVGWSYLPKFEKND